MRQDQELHPTTVTVGRDLVVNRLGYGAMRLTGPGMWGETPDLAGGIALLRKVVDSGVQFIDTADAYGPHTNESLIRDALHPYPNDLVIATKGGFIRGGPDYADFGAVGNREYLRQCAYLSARRLGVDRLDLYYLHSPNATDVPFIDQVATLAELREEGLIRHIGLSNVSVEQFHAASQIVEIAAVTALYNIGERTGAELLAAAEQTGAVFSPWHPTTVPNTGPNAAGIGAALDSLCAKYHATVPQLALAWLLHNSPIMLPIPGTSSPSHLDENLAAASIELTAEDVKAITDLMPRLP
ncbi:aldo/keto reductase [Streptacidiphilus anmyonensis]|uniref:aldo/keto reductase n=1 Tax=Streptacidiphilus anmyonensis TaxID=405782 RepID=UPI0005A6A254|nr:aldo/keto reductase [Streptacidiphilus anmyonensis]